MLGPPEYSSVQIDLPPPKEDLENDQDQDPWELPELEETGTSWTDLTLCGKLKRVLLGWVGKFLALLVLLYFFICSLDFLSSAFRLLGGKAAGGAFTSNALIQNPIAGLMIGILATVLVQSSSTSTSIVVTMVASGIMNVKPAIPIIMGANIGTSVTNTLVSLAQSSKPDEFRRAFAGATVHDMFNWLSVLVLLPLEVATGYLNLLTGVLVKSLETKQNYGSKQQFLKAITKPFTSKVIQLDKKIIEKIATGHSEYAEKSLVKMWCKYEEVTMVQNVTDLQNVTLDGSTMTPNISGGLASNMEGLQNVTTLQNMTVKIPIEQCSFLFHDTGLSDTLLGLILLAVSLFILCTCLILMVKLLHSMLKGRIATIIKKTLNADFPGKLSFLTGYLAIFIGAGMTILVQSSSVFTSAMTPLVGIGVIRLERMYPLTLGSNIGTTATSLLAAMAASGDKLQAALQIGLCHLFFNISGILLFYPIPAMRIPIRLAKFMGNTTAKYRWFAVFYLIAMFFFLPGAVFALSMWGLIPLMVVVGLAFAVALGVIILNILQNKCPQILPAKLRDWEFLPEWMHSLEPLDRLIKKLIHVFRRCCPFKCCQAKKPVTVQHVEEPSSPIYLPPEIYPGVLPPSPDNNPAILATTVSGNLTITAL